MEEEEKQMSPAQKTLIGLAFIFLLAVVALVLPQRRSQDNEINQELLEQLLKEQQSQQEDTEEMELEIEDIKAGEGEEVKEGDSVSVHYTGTLTDGTKFDSSVDRDEPFSFVVGAGEVIQGWDEGLIGMQVGGVRKLTIPPSLGYGEVGAPPANGPNETLIFEIELLEIS